MIKSLSLENPFWRWLAGTLVVGALAALFVYRQTESEREVRNMPAAERRALYQRTLGTLKGTCLSDMGPTMKDYCREQAEFIELFSECDASCRTLVMQLTAVPTR
jgi:hypothetical protein